MRAFVLAALVALLLAGCAAPAVTPAAAPAPAVPDVVPLPEKVAHAAGGQALPLPAAVPEVRTKTLEFAGAEPTLGVLPNGHVFLVANANVLRSVDGGQAWSVVSTPVSSPTTLDPFVYVDPETGRVWSDQLYVGCSYLSYSDDEGQTWITNPAACGMPANDHQKLVTGKNVGPIPQTPLYPKVLYYGYNDVAGTGSRISMSFDGGLTWPVNGNSFPTGYCNGGLHGNILTAADGTVYIPKRDCEGFVLGKSMDSGMTWKQIPVGKDAGGSACRKNPDLALDSAGNLYGAWPGKSNHMYLSTSRDKGETWLNQSLDVSPPGVNMTVMPAVVAGDPGRIALVYYGTASGAKGPDEVEETAPWYLYVSYSDNALDPTPTFVTVRASQDPVQIGGISTNSDCKAPAGSRNLLDFLDAQLTKDGRLVIAYADGCVDACVTSMKMDDSRAARVAFGVLDKGPSLFAAVGELTEPFAGGKASG